MKRVYVNEKWCLGCKLCEYNCAFANSGKDDMVKALKDIKINPRIKVEKKMELVLLFNVDIVRIQFVFEFALLAHFS